MLGVGSAIVRAASADVPADGIASAPLAARSSPRGPTLFSRLSPQETGIVTENAFDDPTMWGEHFDEFRFGAIGTGVAVGDCDHDGRPDLFVVSKTGLCRLFRNLGDWKFADVTVSAGLDTSGSWTDTVKGWVGMGSASADRPAAWKQGATFVDVNNDGWLDLYVCRFGAPNWLFVNQGAPGGKWAGFREEAAARGLALADGSAMGAFCDYDRDGWLDVYVQTNLLDNANHPQGQRDHLYHNNGDGTFTDVSDAAGISGETQGHSATWWDYDNDGWPDLYVANDFAPPDQLYHNNRDGTFTDTLNSVLPHQPFSAMGADLGDVDNDGRIDLLVADMAATTHEQDQKGMAHSRSLTRVVVDDPAVAPQYSRNALYLNTGVGSFREGACLAGIGATDWTWAVRWEDLDNDGRLDLYVTNGMNRDFQNTDLMDRMMVAESPAERMRLVRTSPVLAQANLAFRNLGNLAFESVGPAWGLDETGVSFGAAFGDFDGDGDLDVVCANFETGVSVLRNDGMSGHRVIFDLRGRESNRYGVGAVVRLESAAGLQVRQLVLARGYLSSSEPMLHFGLGDDREITRVTVTWPSGHVQTFAHLAADCRYTVTEPDTPIVPSRVPPAAPPTQFREISATVNLDFSTSEKTVEDPNAQPLVPVSFSHLGPALVVNDVDGDGREDLVVGGTSGTPARLLLANASGRYVAGDATALVSDAVLSDGPVLAFDVDGDGHDDLMVTRAGTARPADAPEYQPQLYRNDGHGHFSLANSWTLPELPLSVGAAIAGDFNRDGHLDVFLGARVRPHEYPRAPRSALLVNHGGRFEDVTDALAPGLREVGLVSSALWTDVDGDGWPDLVLALKWGTVRYWHNNQGRGFEDRSEAAGFEAAGSGWWTALAAADFNGDGRLDYVAGNVGMNTIYRASHRQPAVLFYGRFGNGGTPLDIEARYEHGRLYPWRTRRELGERVHSVRRMFPRNDAYAKATVEDIFGKERLAYSRRYAAREFRSGVFLSQADGTFRFRELPRMAQIAPCQGIVAGDFDGDGRADIYVVQNSWSSHRAMHLDGGISQFLRGDGEGNFDAVEPVDSGLVVPGDAKALVVLDLDDDRWPDFVLTRNNRTGLAFRNTPMAGRDFLRVRLRGPVGNANAIGAQVTCELADQSTQLCEINAGSGYYSQSTARCFFGFTADNPPRRLRVRWPTGTTSTYEVPPSRRVMEVAAP